jgi:hypothetical protein
MQIENFYMAVGKIVPELYGKSAEHMNIHAPASGIVFDKIRKLGWKSRDVAEAFEQIALFARFECSEKIENINGNEQPRVAHFN